jgi:Roadblock/LC7 domain
VGVPMDHDAGAAGGVGQLDWLLDDLVRRVGHVTKAVILSQDGMALGASQSLGRDDAEHLAALSAGFQSLARGAARHFGNGGGVRQTIIEIPADLGRGQRYLPGRHRRAGRRPRPGGLRDGHPRPQDR